MTDNQKLIKSAEPIVNKLLSEWQLIPGLSSKLCMRFFLGHFRKTVRVSHIEAHISTSGKFCPDVEPFGQFFPNGGGNLRKDAGTH